MGEDGSGKTTLVSIISGILKCDDGTMEKDCKHYKPVDTLDDNKHGVSIILQEMSTIDGISIAQNIFFGLEKRFSKGGFLNLRKMNASVKELQELFGMSDRIIIMRQGKISDIVKRGMYYQRGIPFKLHDLMPAVRERC